ncbi:MAG TPA: 6,7-dimethyl-8-ribityllumazine synthase [Planctomycetaceae bacterium]|nr:6,7-dimethyl-8-ribityllumazine synthase [Planctomycetaceae bacterium]
MQAGAPDSQSLAVSRDHRFAIVVSRYNEDVTGRLLDGALAMLHEHGVDDERITTVRVPGAFEIPLAADRLARSSQYAAVVCLGAVIQGETMHHEYINQQVAAGLMRVGLETGVPITFGVLTCQTLQQALDRAGGPHGNKGREAALAALEMVALLRQIDE